MSHMEISSKLKWGHEYGFEIQQTYFPYPYMLCIG